MALGNETDGEHVPKGPRILISTRMLVFLRRCLQTVFLLYFLMLLVQTRLSTDILIDYSIALEGSRPFVIDRSVDFFFRIDPLLRLTTLVGGTPWWTGMVWVAGLVVLTVLLGRVFCGFICPFGSLHHLASLGVRPRHTSNAAFDAHFLKYAVLAAVVVSALPGLQLAGVLDPLCLMFRSLALAVFPGIGVLLKSGFDALAASDIKWLNWISYAAEMVVSPVFGYGYPGYQTAGFIGILFVTLLGINRFSPRFWCRVLCPLGALLGLFSRWAPLRLVTNPGRCTSCGLCHQGCPASARSASSPDVCDSSECLLCLRCMRLCPQEAISLGFVPMASSIPFAPKRRVLLSGMASGMILPVLSRADGRLFSASDPMLIRPPGALNEIDFLAVCARCGLCMKVCPTNAIQPAFNEAGWGGFWTPIVVPKYGYCELACTLCSQICPTGAIRPISSEEKKRTPIRIGSAAVDRGRCLPWSGNGPCIVCEEVCPTSPKAIVFETIDIRDAGGSQMSLKLPKVLLKHCVGCGICENKCPVSGMAAIRVIAAGETRNPLHRLLL